MKLLILMLSLILVVMCYNKRDILVDEVMALLFDPVEALDQATFNVEAAKRINTHRERAAHPPHPIKFLFQVLV